MENSIFQNPGLYESQYLNLTRDCRFYASLASKINQPVLELGVGTGRIALEILKLGIPLTGIDLSKPMLEQASRNLKPYSHLCRLVQASFTNFQFEEKFGLVLCAFNSMNHLNGLEQLQNFLQRVRHHLQPQGFFSFDLINPSPEQFLDTNEPFLRERFFDEETAQGCEVWEKSSYHAKTQTKHMVWTYRWSNGKEVTQTLTHHLHFPTQIKSALLSSQFKIIQQSGDFKGASLTPISTRQIYVCQKD